MRISSLVTTVAMGVALWACSSAEGSTESTDQEVRRANPPCGAESADAATAKDSGPACATQSEAKCVTMNSCRAGYHGLCDCTCTPFTAADGNRYETGAGCTECPAHCFAFAACVNP